MNLGILFYYVRVTGVLVPLKIKPASLLNYLFDTASASILLGCKLVLGRGQAFFLLLIDSCAIAGYTDPPIELLRNIVKTGLDTRIVESTI